MKLWISFKYLIIIFFVFQDRTFKNYFENEANTISIKKHNYIKNKLKIRNIKTRFLHQQGRTTTDNLKFMNFPEDKKLNKSLILGGGSLIYAGLKSNIYKKKLGLAKDFELQ